MRPISTICAAILIMTFLAPVVSAQLATEGFATIFNGTDLDGWDGDTRFWSVKDGIIRGETTEDNPTEGNTFLVWRGGDPKDFILRIKFRLRNGNSGVQYRSKEMSQWRITGYQAEVENNPGKVGFLYHEAGRGWLVNVGDFMVIEEDNQQSVVGKVSDVEQLKYWNYYNDQDWNEYIIICQGNYIRHYLNGYPTMALIDNDRVLDSANPEDRKGAPRDGVIALQIHQGPPMLVEFKDIYVRNLDSNYGKAVRIFNGESLDGWVPMNENSADTFGVANGVMTNTGKPAGYIRTVADYTKFALHVQMKHVEAGNSGVLVRRTGDDKVWPKSIEAQGQSGSMGDIWNIDKVKMNVAQDRTNGRHTRRMYDPNEASIGYWNDYEVWLDGGDLEIRVNNLAQNTATDVEEVAGSICLQAEGSAKEFRNIVLVPID
ncbi:MAG TPA: DUF1080 domain-containing protein, partial [Armatimonadota bacterium]|nr:DUF1080 domain-containing protein [Armatimonadota bacterium]